MLILAAPLLAVLATSTLIEPIMLMLALLPPLLAVLATSTLTLVLLLAILASKMLILI